MSSKEVNAMALGEWHVYVTTIVRGVRKQLYRNTPQNIMRRLDEYEQRIQSVATARARTAWAAGFDSFVDGTPCVHAAAGRFLAPKFARVTRLARRLTKKLQRLNRIITKTARKKDARYAGGTLRRQARQGSPLPFGPNMKIGTSSFVVALLLAILCSSCCTQTLWDNVDPDERIWIPANAITEASLIKKGIEYKKFDREDPKGYLVMKSSMRKFGEYTLLTLATPITVTVDGAIVAVYLWARLGGPGLR